MPAWIVITVEDLNDYLTGVQVEALRSVALAEEQTDPFPRVMADIAQRIRLKIESCRANQLSATANALPPELKWAACYLIIEAMQTRLPGLKLTEEQRNQVERAVATLNRVADCKDAVSLPDDPLDRVSQSGAPVSMTANTREATREKMSGL